MLVLLLLLAADPEMLRVEPGSLIIEDSGTGLKTNVRVGAFLLGRTEVTRAEYRRVTGASIEASQRPVDNVSWQDAVRYANRRSTLEKLTPCYSATLERVSKCNGYRLPTNAEWTIAAQQAGDLTRANLRTGGHEDIAALTGLATRDVASGAPNSLGFHDLYGNVWEWCEDWYTADPLLDSVRDPQGPLRGVEKLIRGGSYLSSRSQWNKGFVSSFAPDRRGPYTGFRLARSLTPAAPLPPADSTWLEQFQQRPATLPTTLPPIDPTTVPGLRREWATILGLPKPSHLPPAIRPIQQFRETTWNGQLLDLQVEPAWTSRVLVMEPARKPAGRLPVVIVPFYDVDAPAGQNLGGRRTGGGTRAFGRLAVQRGFLAVAIRWYGEGDGEAYDESVALLAQRRPGLTGLGKVVLDTQRLIDYLVTRPDVDPARIGIIGHSLGGKMALYATAFEPRIRAIVSSEPGIAFKFTNYEAFWYLGKNLPANRDQHELLALIAPRPFLLIAGESADGDKSWPYLVAAQPLYPNPQHLGSLNHRQGHSPTPDSVTAAMDWLERFLLPDAPGR